MRIYTVAALGGMMLGAWLVTANTASAADVHVNAGNVYLVSDNVGPRGMDPRMAPPPPNIRPDMRQPGLHNGNRHAPAPRHMNNGRPGGPQKGHMAPPPKPHKPPKHYKHNNGKKPYPPQPYMYHDGRPHRP